MKPREFNLRLELSDQANILRIYSWIRTYGYNVRPMGKMERRIRHRGAFKKPGGRRSIFRRTRAGV